MLMIIIMMIYSLDCLLIIMQTFYHGLLLTITVIAYNNIIINYLYYIHCKAFGSQAIFILMELFFWKESLKKQFTIIPYHSNA